MAEEQKYNMSKTLIKMFRQVVPGECGDIRSFVEVNEMAIKRGYLVMPEACTELVVEWLADERFDPNATFYKEWKDIQDRNQLELLFDQIMHYISTYGTDFAAGNGYVPNDGRDKPMMSFETLKAVTVTTPEEMQLRCIKMLQSGVALKEDTMKALVDYIVHHGGCLADNLANKEAACMLHAEQGTSPTNPVEFVRFLVYLYTGKTLLIKSNSVIREIQSDYTDKGAKVLANLNDSDINRLATVFYRYKPLLLAMKHQVCRTCDLKLRKAVHHTVNLIRVRARKLKQPFVPGILDTICVPGDGAKLTQIKAALDGAGMFRRFRLLQCVVDRMAAAPDEIPVYNVRNGKTYIRKGYQPKADTLWLQSVQGVILASISEFLAKKAKTRKVRLPENISLALPTSEKSFLGDYPLGTMIPLSEHNVVGVYWRNEWGTRDFDLSLVDAEGHGVSWHNTFKDADYLHSGDMTTAEPEAAECIYFKGNSCVGKAVNLNQFNGSDPNGKYRFFVAKYDGKPEKFNRGYMVDPKDIVFTTDGNIVAKCTTLAAVCQGYIVLLGRATGNNIITLADGNTASLIDAYNKKTEHAIRLVSLFKLLGFDIVGKDYEGEVDLDLTDPKRDTLIKFFTEEKEVNE